MLEPENCDFIRLFDKTKHYYLHLMVPKDRNNIEGEIKNPRDYKETLDLLVNRLIKDSKYTGKSIHFEDEDLGSMVINSKFLFNQIKEHYYNKFLTQTSKYSKDWEVYDDINGSFSYIESRIKDKIKSAICELIIESEYMSHLYGDVNIENLKTRDIRNKVFKDSVTDITKKLGTVRPGGSDGFIDEEKIKQIATYYDYFIGKIRAVKKKYIERSEINTIKISEDLHNNLISELDQKILAHLREESASKIAYLQESPTIIANNLLMNKFNCWVDNSTFSKKIRKIIKENKRIEKEKAIAQKEYDEELCRLPTDPEVLKIWKTTNLTWSISPPEELPPSEIS